MITDEMLDAAENAYLDNLPKNADPAVYTKAMRAALEAAEKAAWRPIEEAPRGGTIFLLGGGSYHCEARDTTILEPATAAWHKGYGGFWLIAGAASGYSCIGYDNPTHFRQLPKGPEE